MEQRDMRCAVGHFGERVCFLFLVLFSNYDIHALSRLLMAYAQYTNVI